MPTNYTINLKPVYSQTALTPEGLKLPKDWLLSWHQIATHEALRDRNIDVVFNTAMTGDGKSLAAYLQVLLGDCFAIGFYPTNELARDQQTQIQGYIEQFQPIHDLRVIRLITTTLKWRKLKKISLVSGEQKRLHQKVSLSFL